MGNHVPSRRPPAAVLDLGSNTVLLLVLESNGCVCAEASRITRLGQAVFASGRLHPEAARRTREAVAEMAGIARRAGAERLVAVGTAALRQAADGFEFLRELVSEGFVDEARVLSGLDEARYAIEATRRAAEAAGARDGVCVIDVGGGSTEFAWSRPAAEPVGQSFEVGAVRLTERLVSAHPLPPGEIAALRGACADAFAGLERPPLEAPLASAVAVAGTATTLAALDLRLEPWDANAVEGWTGSLALLSAWIERLAALDVAARRALPGLEPGRADVIVAGLVALEQALVAVGVETLVVSGRGVRHGLALELLETLEVPENAC